MSYGYISTDYLLEAIGNLRNAQKQPEYRNVKHELDGMIKRLIEQRKEYHGLPRTATSAGVEAGQNSKS